MTLQQLIYFQKIANLQHYNKAAKELHVAQPSLSKSMALLEEELQVPLFEKQGRNIILTQYGKVFLEHVDIILDEIKLAKNHVQGMLDRHIGHINVAYISPFGPHYIPRMVHKFLQREENHKVTFSFKEGFTSSMIKAVHDGEVDVVFGSFEKNEPDLEFFQIVQEDLILIAPLNMEIEPGRRYSLHDFTETPFIAYDRISNMGKYVHELFDEEKLHMNVVCESSDEISILPLVANEFGISYVAKTEEVIAAIEKGKVKQIPIQEQNQRTLHMIYEKEKFHSPAVLDFIQFIKENYR
jgi:DNA-binding transcriptional LysR family regulator